jgi:ABC-2 type transport system permease protein
MDRLYLKIYKIGLKISLSKAKKSPANFWLSATINFVYYLAQATSWLVLNSHDSFQGFMSESYILIFFITVSMVDNLYLLFFGQSSIQLQNRVKNLSLDTHLLLPVNLPIYYILTTISLEHIILTVISFIAFIAVHCYLQTQTQTLIILLHLILILQGSVVLASISWLYRCTVFWSNTLVNVRNSNPSFKVLIRPFESFQGAARIFFMVIIPCLFITGVPAYIVGSHIDYLLIFCQTLVTFSLILICNWVFNIGIKRYARVVT